MVVSRPPRRALPGLPAYKELEEDPGIASLLFWAVVWVCRPTSSPDSRPGPLPNHTPAAHGTKLPPYLSLRLLPVAVVGAGVFGACAGSWERLRPCIPTTRMGGPSSASVLPPWATIPRPKWAELPNLGRNLRGKGLAWRPPGGRCHCCHPEAQVGQVIKVPDGLCHFYTRAVPPTTRHTRACAKSQEVMSTRVDYTIHHNTA